MPKQQKHVSLVIYKERWAPYVNNGSNSIVQIRNSAIGDDQQNEIMHSVPGIGGESEMPTIHLTPRRPSNKRQLTEQRG